jgi:hypothetical protein
MDRTHHHNPQSGAGSLVGVVGRGDLHHVAGRQLGQLASSRLERPGHGHPPVAWRGATPDDADHHRRRASRAQDIDVLVAAFAAAEPAGIPVPPLDRIVASGAT